MEMEVIGTTRIITGMMNEEECIHDLPVGQCTTCKEASYKTTLSHPFQAQYPGRCYKCDEFYEEGDYIVRVDRVVTYYYIHEEC